MKLISTSAAAAIMDVSSTDVARKYLRRWGVHPISRQPGASGENLFDENEVRQALANPPRRGRPAGSRTTITTRGGNAYTGASPASIIRREYGRRAQVRPYDKGPHLALIVLPYDDAQGGSTVLGEIHEVHQSGQSLTWSELYEQLDPEQTAE